MAEKAIIIGAGIGGLMSAMALGHAGFDVTVLDRDPHPPETSPNEVFDTWQHKGVGHVRHSHAFLARLYVLIRDHYPQLMKDLLDAGCRILPFENMVPEISRSKFVARPSDEDLNILTSRRTTLELIMRRFVERQTNVRIEADVKVRELITTHAKDGTLTVTGLTGELADGTTHQWTPDFVVDASGKNAPAMDWLKEAGVEIEEEAEPAGILYFTRHYRLLDGQEEPDRDTTPPSSGDLGYIKFGIFPADNRRFSVTLAIPEIEMELRKAAVDPAIFDNICMNIPGLACWIDPARAEPVSRVFGMGELISRWRYMVKDNQPKALNFFPVGDCLIRTNPLYGRGCSFAAISAHLLSDALLASKDPVTRARTYHASVEKEIRPFYDNMVSQDLSAIRRARNTLDPTYRPSLKTRIVKSFVEDGVTIAVRADTNLLRRAMAAFHMIEAPNDWLKEPGNFARVLMYWARTRWLNARYYPPSLGPKREDMFKRLNLSASADVERLKEAA